MCAEQSPSSTEVGRPSIDALQRDIEFANTFRLEKLKTMLAITTALLAFTMTFRPKLSAAQFEWAMVVGWIGLSVSLLTGIAAMQAWEQFYISYRNYDWKGKPEEGKRRRKVITGWRRFLFALECIGFLIGLTGIGLFAAVNVHNVQVEHAEANE